jgi:RNA polymerase sigma factor (sigma-70 family)
MINKFEFSPTVIQSLKEHDRSVQQLVYQYLAPKMMAVCKRYIKEDFDAEEAFQHAFIKVFKSVHQYKAEGNFEAWVRRIMVNECLAQLRKKEHIMLSLESDDAKAYEPIDQTLPDHHLNNKELLAILQSLPYGYRTVLNMYAIEGYSHAEIAQLLKISEGTSKSQLARAREAFRNKLHQSQSQHYAI